jgi:hypothetical protein
MDDRFAPQPIARWFMPAAIASLLFMLLGCAVQLLGMTTDPATLPLDQRAAQEAQPLWLTSAFAAGVWVGALGALLLVLRRKLAEPLLLVSLAATAIWLVGLFAAPGLRELLGTDDFAVAIVVALVTWTIYWFARHSRQRGWLR